ncbi:pyocin knob domain-containing protein [Pseudomonas oryzihabitans]|uniref:pyocin knob domain-containing protein n=1 Tax=Pseudomonas oryzihabitans TaxID=47885 RepID=UPI0011A0D3D8|nr:pyocin knob domain-containing protein [Pseudomonas oryzihabitans]
MALQQVNFGSASDGSQGDTARAAFGKINQNFSDTTNAASRLVGTAAGQVMEVGAFGVGSAVQAVSSDDLNTYQTAGQRKFTNATAANVPYAEYGYLHVEGVGDVANRVAQTWVSRTNRRFSRTLQADGWTAWKEVAMSGDSPVFSSASLSRTSAGSAQLNLSALAGNYRFLRFLTNGAVRWDFGVSDGAEAGSNAGSDFYINRFSDAAGFLDSPWGISRATGETRMTRAAVSGPLRPGQYTLASLPSASAFTGYEIDVTDAAGGAKRCRSDGTNWKILNTTTTVS